MKEIGLDSRLSRFGRILSLACSLVIAVPVESFAWGSSGHRMIGQLAIRNLPPDIPEFLRRDVTIWQTGELSREPDRSRGSGSPHDRDRDPGHFIDTSDDLTINGGPRLSDLPATREDYDTALRATGTDQYRIGFLPYQIMDGWQQLVTDFALWRADLAGEKYAATEAQRDWFRSDRALREAITVRDLGYWSHFVGDGSQPMHVSVHYDGWGNFPNPQGFPDQRGLHARFEGAYVRDQVGDDDVTAVVAPYNPLNSTIQERVGKYLLATQQKITPLFELEQQHAFDPGNPAGKPFVAERLAAAVSELRDMIVDAWVLSAKVKVGYPPVWVNDLERGFVDGFGSLAGED